MFVNSSSLTSSDFNVYDCLDVNVVIFIAIAFTITKVFLVLPLSIFVLCMGHQHWLQQRSFKTTSHSDFFTFQMAVIELIGALGWGLLCCSSYIHIFLMAVVGLNVFFSIFPGQTLFHVLTCLERYLAVVHPITYRELKQSGGIRIRNICTGCVWLLCGGWCGVIALYYPELPMIPFFSFLILSLLVVSFCSISVLCVLIRPGPGDVGKDRERVDQVKQKALYTIMSIMGVLSLLFVGFLVCRGLTTASLLNDRSGCVALISAMWFKLPCSLVSPLLFLHRTGKLPFCSSSAK